MTLCMAVKKCDTQHKIVPSVAIKPVMRNVVMLNVLAPSKIH
jgi:hypothetical protein